MQYTFENLEVWQKARKIVKSVYNVTSTFPDKEKFRLTSDCIGRVEFIVSIDPKTYKLINS